MVTLDQAGRDPGLVLRVPRDTAIGAFTDMISVQQRRGPLIGASQWRIVADDAPHLILQSIDDTKGTVHRVVVVGARRIYADIDISRRSLTVVARLRPGALPALFGYPASELTDDGYLLEDVAGSRVRGPLERLIAEAADAPIPAMMTFLSSMFSRSRPINARISALSRLPAAEPVEVCDIAKTLGMSTRGLRSLLHREAGMSPKRFMRIRRLHSAIAGGLGSSRLNWTAAALDAGYFDQAHFVHECRALLGESPTAFHRRRTP